MQTYFNPLGPEGPQTLFPVKVQKNLIVFQTQKIDFRWSITLCVGGVLTLKPKICNTTSQQCTFVKESAVSLCTVYLVGTVHEPLVHYSSLLLKWEQVFKWEINAQEKNRVEER